MIPGDGGAVPVGGTPVLVATGLTPMGLTTLGLTSVGQVSTGLSSEALASVGRAAAESTSMDVRQAGRSGQGLPVTGASVQIELLLAGLSIGLGSLLVLLSQPQRRARRRSAAAR